MPSRLLHTMLRVNDLDKAIEFYTKVLGMQLVRYREFPEASFSLAFLGYGSENDNTVLELTYNWGEQTPYEKGGAYGHIAIQVDDVYKACESIAELGGKIIRPAGPMKGGSTVIAFVEDPDGYKVELLGPRDYNLDGIEGYVPGQCNK